MITPPVTIMTHGIVAVAAAAGAWVWQANSYEAKLAAVQTEYAQAQHTAIEVAHAETIRLQTRKDEADKRAMVRENRMVADRDLLRVALDGLRGDLANGATRYATATEQARADYTATLSALLSDCAGMAGEIAGKADGHVIDLQRLSEAWPTQE